MRVVLGSAFVALTLAIVPALPPARAAAQQQQSPWFGTWALNLSKSSPTPYKRATCRIEPWMDQVRVSYDLVYDRGGVTHLEWTGRFDGEDYLVQGLDDVVTNAYARVDDRTFQIIVKADTHVVAVSKSTLAPDGRSIATVTPGRNDQGAGTATSVVYDRLR